MIFRMRLHGIPALLCVVLAAALFSFRDAAQKNLTSASSTRRSSWTTGRSFSGKMERAGSPYPLLREVYYIGRQASPDGKEVKNILIKRGNEWHAPEYMYINSSHIVVVEPVAANSRVAQLIKEAKTQQPQPAQQQ